MKAIKTLHYKIVKGNLHKNKLAFAENERTKNKHTYKNNKEKTRIWGTPL